MSPGTRASPPFEDCVGDIDSALFGAECGFLLQTVMSLESDEKHFVFFCRTVGCEGLNEQLTI
jgi:hypothetical protein